MINLLNDLIALSKKHDDDESLSELIRDKAIQVNSNNKGSFTIQSSMNENSVTRFNRALDRINYDLGFNIYDLKKRRLELNIKKRYVCDTVEIYERDLKDIENEKFTVNSYFIAKQLDEFYKEIASEQKKLEGVIVNIEGVNYLTVKDYALKHDLKPSTVQNWVSLGKIESIKHQRIRLVKV